MRRSYSDSDKFVMLTFILGLIFVLAWFYSQGPDHLDRTHHHQPRHLPTFEETTAKP